MFEEHTYGLCQLQLFAIFLSCDFTNYILLLSERYNFNNIFPLILLSVSYPHILCLHFSALRSIGLYLSCQEIIGRSFFMPVKMNEVLTVLDSGGEKIVLIASKCCGNVQCLKDSSAQESREFLLRLGVQSNHGLLQYLMQSLRTELLGFQCVSG